MNVLGVIQRLAKFVGNAIPEAVYSSDQRTDEEFGELANTMAEQIASEHDWQRLRRLSTITGDGTTQAFTLPYDFSRMWAGTDLRTSEGRLQHVTDHNVWLDWQLRSYAPAIGAWTLLGDQIEILPVPTSGRLIKFWYQSDRIVRSNGTAANSSFPYNLPFELADSDAYGYALTTFQADSDFFQLSWRLLELGMRWQWKANKGLPYGEDMQTFELEKARLIKRERTSPVLEVCGRTYWDESVEIAYPRTLSAS